MSEQSKVVPPILKALVNISLLLFEVECVQGLFIIC